MLIFNKLVTTYLKYNYLIVKVSSNVSIITPTIVDTLSS